MPPVRRTKALRLLVPIAAFAVAGAGLLAIVTHSVIAIEIVLPVLLVVLAGGVLVLARLLESREAEAEQRALGETEERTRRILDRAHEAYIAMDAEGVVIAWNAAAETMFGWSRREAVGRSLAGLIIPEDQRDQHHDGLKRYQETGYGPMIGPRTEVLGRHRDGTDIPVELSIIAIDEADARTTFHGFVRDITDRKLFEAHQRQRLEAAEQSARIDDLTALPNRRGWDEAFKRELARTRRDKDPLCVAVLDLDHFKAYNDANGHRAGDALLRRAASAWKLALRQSDLIARYGGEEFAVLLPVCGLDEAMRVIERLRAVTPEEETVSAGVAAWNGYEDADSMIERADLALYQAKREGRNRSTAAA